MARKIYGGVDLVGGRAQHVADPAHDDDAATKGWIEALLNLFTPMPRVGTVTSASAVTINADNFDAFNITALTSDTFISISGTPRDHQKLMVRIADGGISQMVRWDPGWFRNSGVATLLDSTAPGRIHHVGLVFDATARAFFCLAVDAIGA